MKLNQIREYSKKSLKGRRAEAFMISLCIPAVIVFFRLIELCTASVILYIYDLSPMKLFYGSEIMWTIFDIICVFFKTILLSGIMAMVIKYFSELLDIKLKEQKSTLLFRKNFILGLTVKLLSLIFLLPSVLFGYLSAKLILSKNGESVFLMIHTLTLMIISVFIWIWVILGFTALPFLTARESGKEVLKLIPVSFRIIKGSRSGLLKIILFYMPTFLIPFLFLYTLPEFFSSLTLYINICIKEAEYIGRKNLYSRKSESHNASKISHRKKRHIKTASDKAEA